MFFCLSKVLKERQIQFCEIWFVVILSVVVPLTTRVWIVKFSHHYFLNSEYDKI